MAFLIQSLTAPPEAGSIPEENASHRLQKYFGKNSESHFTVDGVGGLEE